MTPEEVAERLIEAAELERRMPRAGTAPRGDGGGYTLPWVHSLADVHSRFKTAGDRLLPGDDPLRQWREEAWSAGVVPLTSAEVGRWEEVVGWVIDLVEDARCRRAVWRWAIAKAGGRPFARWCQKEGIALETGRRRKNRAIAAISARLSCTAPQNSSCDQSILLIRGGEIIHPVDTMGGIAREPKRYTWRDDDSLKPVIEYGRKRFRGYR